MRITSLSQIGETIAFTPDVYSACNFAISQNHLILSNEQVQLDINGPETTLKFKFTDHPEIGRDKMEEISFALALNGIRLAAGENWTPS